MLLIDTFFFVQKEAKILDEGIVAFGGAVEDVLSEFGNVSI